MKFFTRTSKIGLVMLFVTLTSGIANAQGIYGATPEDSVACIEAISLYREFVKQKNYKDAYPFWVKAWTICPAARKTTHIDGEKMFKQFIKDRKGDEARQAQAIDTLMLVYDVRMETFPEDRCTVLQKKGAAILKYQKDEYEKAYNTLKEAHETACGDERLNAGGVSYYYNAAYYMYGKKKMEKVTFLELYSTLSDDCDEAIKRAKAAGDEKDVENYQTAQENLDKLFSQVADCEALVELFGPKYNETPEDSKLLGTIVKLFDKKECYDNDLYPQVMKTYLANNPTAEGYFSFGKYLATKGECTDAIENLEKAVELSDDNDLKLEAYYTISQCQYNNRNMPAVRTYCNKALGINPNYGAAYIMIGNAYAASGVKGDNDCTNRAKFWAAYDAYAQARSVDASVAEEAGKKMGGAAGNFPEQQACFFAGLNEGDSYTVGGWIQVTTTVRFKK